MLQTAWLLEEESLQNHQMYEGYKFDKIENIVLYSIAEKRKPLLQEEIYKSLPEIVIVTINAAVRKLSKENLIRKTGGRGWRNFIFLNTKKIAMEKIKKMLKPHWETN